MPAGGLEDVPAADGEFTATAAEMTCRVACEDDAGSAFFRLVALLTR